MNIQFRNVLCAGMPFFLNAFMSTSSCITFHTKSDKAVLSQRTDEEDRTGPGYQSRLLLSWAALHKSLNLSELQSPHWEMGPTIPLLAALEDYFEKSRRPVAMKLFSKLPRTH